MGRKSDWVGMRQADETLTNFGVPHECRVLSAHRTPAETAEYISQAEGRGVEVVIAAAGGIAFLGEQLGARLLVASAAILGGIALVLVDRPRAG